ncbi:major facilitator superfamily multidrug-resistance, DHA1 sub-family [Lyophyllum atratum]|nr:major facilitator superfamily multidrug-resistance, DHA1 sub-family [Lyophyllum atratum]
MHPEEETRDHEVPEPTKPKRTPLPTFQLFIVFLIQFAEPVTATVIYPFVNQFVRDTGITGGDERKTGYYAGIIESAFFFAEAFTVFQWGRASDRFGRRPILLLGPIGLSLAMLSFGLSNNFWTLVVSRCMQGVFNGNIGVSKSVMGEITDSTNIADAFAMMPLMWSIGSTVGPILGGLLSQPAKTWPGLFGRLMFFHHYPYFLPCATAALIAFISAVIAFMGLKETLPSAMHQEKRKTAAAVAASCITPGPTTGLLSAEHGPSYGSAAASDSTVEAAPLEEATELPPPLSSLFVPRVLLTLLVYSFLAFVDMSCQVLQPLVYSTSISLGGLGFDPYRIGVIMGTFGVINAIVQLTFLGRAIRKFGPRTIQIIAQVNYAIVLSLYPLLSFFAKRAGGADGYVWAVIIIQLTLAMSFNSAYASIQILILDSAPNRASLGATNGMAQAVGSVMRSIAPSIASSLFSISLQRHLVGGNMVFLILLGVALLGVRLSFLLPKKTTA